MLARFLRGVFWKGKHQKAGDAIDVSQGEYATLVSMNAVEKYVEPIKPENQKIEAAKEEESKQEHKDEKKRR